MGNMVENDRVVELLRTLVQIESLSKKEDKIKRFVREYLKGLGYQVREENFFLATLSSSELIVASHLDTVSVRRTFDTDGIFAYGTGVCDAKASVTAMLLAAEKGVGYSLVFFCDEEEDGLGSREFADVWDSGRNVIVMEPTEFKIASRHWGSFEINIEVRGKEAHGAYPQFGVNAIERMIDIYNMLKKFGFRVNVLKISGGSDLYVIPDRCVAKLEVMLAPDERPNDYIDRLKFIGDVGDFSVDNVYEGYVSRDVSYLERAMMRCGLSVEHTEMFSWTDALNLKDRFDVVVWGPGEITSCHTAEERIRISDILVATEVLLKLDDRSGGI